MTGDAERRSEGFEDPNGDVLGLVLGLDILDEYREFVTAEPCCGIARPQAAAESVCDGDEQFVARGVTETVVDGFEIVEIDEQHRERA